MFGIALHCTVTSHMYRYLLKPNTPELPCLVHVVQRIVLMADYALDYGVW